MEALIYVAFALIILRAIYKRGFISAKNSKSAFNDSGIQNQMMIDQQNIQNQMHQQDIMHQTMTDSQNIQDQMHNQATIEQQNSNH